MLLRLLSAVVSLFVVAAAVLVWELSQGPLSLAFAEPYLEDAARSERGEWRFDVGELVLMPDIRIHARNVDLVAADGTPLLRIPDIIVRPSWYALLRGLIAVSAVEIANPEAYVLRRPDGSFGISVGAADTEVESEADTKFLEDLLGPVRDDRAVGFLRTFEVTDARLFIKDVESGASWTVDDANIRLSRGAKAHRLTLHATLAGQNGGQSTTTNTKTRLESSLDLRPAGEGFVIAGEARATGVDAARLGLYWPQNAAAAARRWVTANITAGTVSEAVLRIALASTEGVAFRLTDLGGNLRYQGLTVRWDDAAPPITAVGGTSTFDGSSMRFNIASGASRSIRIHAGRVDLFDLDGDREHISIEAKARGPFADIVKLVPFAEDRIPFRLSGDAVIDLQAAFPLRAKLGFADVALKVDADPQRVRFDHAAGNATVTGRVRYQKPARKGATVTADLEVDAAHIDAAGFKWTQPAGKKGNVDLHTELGETALTFDPLRIECPGLRAKGGVTLLDGGNSGSAQLRDLAHGDSELDRANVEWSAARVKADLGSGKLHLPTLVGDAANGGDARHGHAVDLEIETGLLHRVSFDADSWLENVRASVVRRNGVWDRIDVRSELPRQLWSADQGISERGSKTFALRLEPAGTGWRLEGRADDFGGLLQAVDVTNGVRGGILEISGRADRDGDAAVLRSHVKATNFVVRDAPLALRILSVAALDKFVTTLKGGGLPFDSLKGTVIVRGSRYQLDNFRAHGVSLGWTAAGWVDTGKDQLQVEGAVIPAYQANKVLKKIPLLGSLLTGPEGRGLIAINYSVRGDVRAPKVSTNPLTALTPGFLRELWELGK